LILLGCDKVLKARFLLNEEYYVIGLHAINSAYLQSLIITVVANNTYKNI
jgi:hypothetical protein